MSRFRDSRSKGSTADLLDDRPLREREVVDIFMKCGVYENVARSIIKLHPQFLKLKVSQKDELKKLLREANDILEKEGVPELVYHRFSEQDQASVKKIRYLLCKVCKDSGVVHVRYPDHMKRYFRREQGFKGHLAEEDWLCRVCYNNWYKDNREVIPELDKQLAEGKSVADDDDDEEEEDETIVKREIYMKLIAPHLLSVMVNLTEEAAPHRKMLINYVTLNKINILQLPHALHYINRKVRGGIIEVEDFEKFCGIGADNQDLWYYGFWNAKYAQREILKIGEQQDLTLAREKLEAERKEKEEKEQAEAEAKRLEQLKTDNEAKVRQAEIDAIKSRIADKRKKLAQKRATEDSNKKTERKEADKLRKTNREKREQERKANSARRERELKEMEAELKQKERTMKENREERYRRQREEIKQRTLQTRNEIDFLKLGIKSKS